MEYVAFSDLRISTAFWIGSISIVLSVLLLVEVLCIRVMEMLRSKLSYSFKCRAQSWLIKVLLGENVPLLRVAKHNLPNFLHLCLHFQEIIRGESKQWLSQVLRNQKLDTKIRQLLNSRKFNEQILAASVLGHLADAQSWELLLVYLKKSSPLLVMIALRSLVSINPAQAFAVALPILVQHPDWMMQRWAILLKQADPQFQQAFLNFVDNVQILPLQTALRLLQLATAIPRNRPLSICRKFLVKDSDPELLAASIRLVCHPSELVAARICFPEQADLVQIQVAALLGKIGASQDLQYIFSMLDSEHWWVRYRAAQALLATPFINRSEIKHLSESCADPFARDMLLLILAEE